MKEMYGNRRENTSFELKTEKFKLPEIIVSRITQTDSPSVLSPSLNPVKRMK